MSLNTFPGISVWVCSVKICVTGLSFIADIVMHASLDLACVKSARTYSFGCDRVFGIHRVSLLGRLLVKRFMYNIHIKKWFWVMSEVLRVFHVKIFVTAYRNGYSAGKSLGNVGWLQGIDYPKFLKIYLALCKGLNGGGYSFSVITPTQASEINILLIVIK